MKGVQEAFALLVATTQRESMMAARLEVRCHRTSLAVDQASVVSAVCLESPVLV